jgi:peptidoglycan/LPS O-acetylase OafA/YrhL
MTNAMQKALQDRDLISACVCGLLAALVMSYVANVSKPGAVHVLLALIGLGAILGGFLFVARSKAESEWKAATAIAGGLVSVLCFLLLSMLY